MRALTSILLALLLTGVASSPRAQAPVRVFPANAQPGMLVMGNFPEAAINGIVVRFAPGARILGQSNTVVTPSSLTSPLRVRFRIDPQGEIDLVWILTADEIAAIPQ
jgi:hypothetical protein